MDTREDLTVIQRFEDRTEAELACGLLVAAGLDASLEEHELLHGVSESLPIEGSVGLMVPPSQSADAIQLLNETRASGGTTTADVTDQAAEQSAEQSAERAAAGAQKEEPGLLLL